MKISLITATYNNGRTVKDTFSSVRKQIKNNYELEYIVIDGKSKDDTLSLIHDNKDIINKHVSEKDSGMYEALNKGIALATGDVIGFLHADDFFPENNILETVAEQFSENKTDSVYGDLNYVGYEKPERIIRKWIAGVFTPRKLQFGWMPPHPTFYVRREIYGRYGLFDTNYSIAADYDIMLRFLWQHRISTQYISKTLVCMRMGGKSNNSVKNIFLKMRDDYIAIKRYKTGGIISLAFKNFRKIPQFFK